MSAIDAVLDDPEQLALFSQYCETKYCSENISFYKAVKEYKALDGEVLRALRAQAIYEKFVVCGAPLQVNLDEMIVIGISDCIENQNTRATLFDKAENSVKLLIQLDTLPGFLAKENKHLEYINQVAESVDNSSESSAIEIEVVGGWSHSQTHTLAETNSSLSKKLGKELVKLDFEKSVVGMESILAEEENKRLDAWCCILEKESATNKKQVIRLQKKAMQLLADTEYLKGREQKLKESLRQVKDALALIDTQ